MHPLRLIAALLILISCKNETPPVVVDNDAAKKEVSVFLNHYGELVRQSKFDSLYTLYEKEGSIRAGIGFLEKNGVIRKSKSFLLIQR